MTFIGYHASHEQFPASELLAHVRHAEEAGFAGAMCSDHLAPWLPGQRGVGQAHAWLGAALQATGFSLGTVSAPGMRYHPAVLAQTAMTLSEMYPGRFWMALGSGEAANEQVTGEPWPAPAERHARLRECAEVMRALFRGEVVDHDGLVRVRQGRVHSTGSPPPLIGAAVSAASAARCAGWADGLITVASSTEALRRTVGAYRDAGGRGPVHLQHQLSWAASDELAMAHAWEQWRQAGVPHPVCMELDTPEHIAKAAATVRPIDLNGPIVIGSDLGRHLAVLTAYAACDVDRIYLHQVGPDQEGFIEAFGAKVIGEVS